LGCDYTPEAGFHVYRVLHTVICPSVGHQYLLVRSAILFVALSLNLFC
jgi:hypothetical protein